MPVATLLAIGGGDDFDHDVARLQVLALVLPKAERFAIAIDAQAPAAGPELADVAAAFLRGDGPLDQLDPARDRGEIGEVIRDMRALYAAREQ